MNRDLVVVKVGGEILLDATEREGLGANIRTLVQAGRKVVVLHGGGPQVTSLQERVGLKEHKVGGRRVTTPADLVVVQQAICGEVNVGLTVALLSAGVRAFGCHGASGGMVRAHKRPPKPVPGAGPEPVDYGEVGDVTSVDAGLVLGLCELGLIPVIATLGVSDDGARAFNINADTTSVHLAAALGADALLMVTKVGGVYRDLRDPSSLVPEMTAAHAQTLIAQGVIAGGMIHKVEEAITALDKGLSSIVNVNANAPEGFLLALQGQGGGTRILP
ncbi:MAG: acetylglutamate kinase [Myxococcota bacterium]